MIRDNVTHQCLTNGTVSRSLINFPLRTDIVFLIRFKHSNIFVFPHCIIACFFNSYEKNKKILPRFHNRISVCYNVILNSLLYLIFLVLYTECPATISYIISITYSVWYAFGTLITFWFSIISLSWTTWRLYCCTENYNTTLVVVCMFTWRIIWRLLSDGGNLNVRSSGNCDTTHLTFSHGPICTVCAVRFLVMALPPGCVHTNRAVVNGPGQ